MEDGSMSSTRKIDQVAPLLRSDSQPHLSRNRRFFCCLPCRRIVGWKCVDMVMDNSEGENALLSYPTNTAMGMQEENEIEGIGSSYSVTEEMEYS
ncbi:hypothetical protein PRIPAC_82989 [Pristionchus pacificus]|uniref:Uncharacterized protein n=1 Tax=Pristionchus pacificus TaxID=54126 RepID=A0A2A6CAW8_PRIPA|nr:hypothetical protein PRIPAC_82989 [Pristionchus pacificus]|eukprot:PDM75208.1 hypothetical protein PRIPAC_43402 [Pristionchus pacificus]